MRSHRTPALLLAAGISLFALFFLHLALAAQGKPFWLDETINLQFFKSSNIWDMIINGVDGEASRSPFHFLSIRALLAFWPDPFRHWDTRFFFRLPMAFFWASANVALFFFAWRRLQPHFTPWLAFALTLGVTCFTFSNAFCVYYGIEARPSALWVSLTLLQYFLLWDVLGGLNRRNGAFLLAANILVTLATYGSIAQTFIVLGLIQLGECFRTGRWRWWGAPQKFIAANVALTAFLTWYYLPPSRVVPVDPPFQLYLDSIIEVILKSFHHHGREPAWVSFPYLFLFVPWYWFRRDKRVFLLCLGAHLGVASTLALFLATFRSGGAFYSRYAIYLVPALTFLYLAGVVAGVQMLAGLVRRFAKRDVFVALMAIWALSQSLPRLGKLVAGLPADIARFQARNTYSLNENPECAQPLPLEVEPFEARNDRCRGL